NTQDCHFTRKALPLNLAHAQTIHKAQGQTMSEVVVVTNNIEKPGQLYVALSRVRALAGLTLTRFNDGKLIEDLRPLVSTRSIDVMKQCQRIFDELPNPSHGHAGLPIKPHKVTEITAMYSATNHPKDSKKVKSH